jgi:hypothetical protein
MKMGTVGQAQSAVTGATAGVKPKSAEEDLEVPAFMRKSLKK